MDRGMKAILLSLVVALLMVGCEEEATFPGEMKMTGTETEKSGPKLPSLFPCEACGQNVSIKTKKCLGCNYPVRNSVVTYKIKWAKRTGASDLNLWANKISDLAPLTELTRLKSLTLSGNQITDLRPLSGLTRLERLQLSNNQIADLTPLESLSNLKAFDRLVREWTEDAGRKLQGRQVRRAFDQLVEERAEVRGRKL